MVELENSRQVTVAVVTEGIRRDILLGVYGEERQISETEVANKYQVSRSSVRSAFQTLERDGLIEVQPNGRKILKRVDHKYIEDLLLTRSILECEVARLIIHKKANDFSALLQIVGEFYSVQQQMSGKEREITLAHLNERFHDQLFVMAGNQALLQCRRTIAPILATMTELNATLNPALNEHPHYKAHKKIAEMLMERDEEAVEYIRYHAIDATLKDFLLVIQNKKENIDK